MLKYIAIFFLFLISIPVQYLPESEAQRKIQAEELLPITERHTSRNILQHKELGRALQTEIKMDTDINGTISFSRDSITELKLYPQRGLGGLAIAKRNSSTISIETVLNGLFVKSFWENKGDHFKLNVCWNLLVPATIEFEFSKYPVFFFDNKFIFNTLTFDWQDAVNDGIVLNYNNNTKTLGFTLTGRGCFDPLITTTTSTSTMGFTRRHNVWNNITNGNWVVTYSRGPGVEATIACLLANVLDVTQFTLQTGGWNDNNGSFSMMAPNLTRVITISGISVTTVTGKGYTFDEDCVMSNPVSKTIQVCCTAPAAIDITYNGSHIFGVGLGYTPQASHQAGIWVCNKSFVSCSSFKLGIPMLYGTGSGAPFQFQGLNVSASQIMLVGYNGTRLKSRIYYANGNQSYGTETLVSSDLIQSKTNHSCIVVNSTRVYCVYMTSTGELKLVKWTGSSWGSPVIIAYPGSSINTMIGISKNNGNNSVAIFRLSGSLFKWNKTHAITESFIDTGQTFTGAQTSPNYLAVSIRPNSTGSVGLMWKNKSASPFNIMFQPVNVWISTPPVGVITIASPRTIESIFAQQVVFLNMTVSDTLGATNIKNLTLKINQTNLIWIRSPESFTATNMSVIYSISGTKTDIGQGYTIAFRIRFSNNMTEGYHQLKDSFAYNNNNQESNHIFITKNITSVNPFNPLYAMQGWFKFFRFPVASAAPISSTDTDMLLGFEALLILPFILLFVIKRRRRKDNVST